jgi:hypothetical protein
VAAGVALLLFLGDTAGFLYCQQAYGSLVCGASTGWGAGLLKQQQQTPCISLPQPAARERAPILADRSARSSGA